jgi:hypothetical protein
VQISDNNLIIYLLCRYFHQELTRACKWVHLGATFSVGQRSVIADSLHLCWSPKGQCTLDICFSAHKPFNYLIIYFSVGCNIIFVLYKLFYFISFFYLIFIIVKLSPFFFTIHFLLLSSINLNIVEQSLLLFA